LPGKIQTTNEPPHPVEQQCVSLKTTELFSHSFWAAMTRDGWRVEERLSPMETLEGFTLGAAYAAFQEDKLGSLEVGKKAHFVILDRDILRASSDDEILGTKVLATVMDGETVFGKV
jgi:predicted amidohydrolase YtcJ